MVKDGLIDEILDTAPCGFLSVSDHGTIVVINTTLLKLLGYESDAIAGRPITEILPVASQVFYQTHIFPLLKLHNKIEEIYFSMRSAQGHDIPVLINAVRRERHECVVNDLVIIPIVQRIQYEDTILRAKKESERLNQLKNDFLSTVSHELRTPMTNIKMATQMLEISLKALGVLTDESTNPAKRYFKILHEEVQRETTLINDLLDLARLDAGTEPLNLTIIALQYWIPHVVEPFVERIHSQQQTLELNIADHLPPLTTDLTYLERILAELVNNACKYTPAQETIALSAQLTPTALQICVTNSGVEIAAEECDRIFDKFYRIPNNDPWKHGGTGLGLALVKKLVEHLGASIYVESGDRQTSFIMEFELQPMDKKH